MNATTLVLLSQVPVPEDRSLTLIILGVVLLLLALAGSIILPKIELRLGKPAGIVVGALGIVLLVLGLRDLYGPSAIPCPVVTIERPTGGELLPRAFTASGTSGESTAEWTLWLVVNPQGEEGWWPQRARLAPVPPDGRWQRNGTLGGVQGQRFQIGVACASPVAHREFVAYLEEGERTGEYPGKALPVGATVAAVVEVIQDE